MMQGGPMKRIALVALSAVLLVGGAFAAPAQEPYYKGTRITVLINFEAGGPTDMDGAGGVVGAQFVGEVAPKDGTVMGYFAGTSWIYVSDPHRWRVDFKSYE